MNRLEGRRALITGGAAGIGLAIVQRFVKEGARVMVADLDGKAARQVARALGAEHLAYQADISKEKEVAEAIGSAVWEWNGLDIMVNNAGIGMAANVESTTVEDFDRVLAVNLKGTFLGMKYAIPAIRDSGGGAIINMSSIAALVGLVDRAAYSAAKGGIYSLTRAAAIDHVEEGVRINCIVPGTVDTPWVQRVTDDYEEPEAARAAMRERQPHGRLVSPEEIAAMAVYLASEEAASAVGAAMVVDGGVTAR